MLEGKAMGTSPGERGWYRAKRFRRSGKIPGQRADDWLLFYKELTPLMPFALRSRSLAPSVAKPMARSQ